MNYVLFFPDEMRAESVSCYGHPLVKMPNYDRLAAQGVRFEQCHVQNPVCSPSRCSLMTGWYPHTAGHRTLWHLLQPQEPSLFEYLHRAGYQIQWFGKNDLYATACLERWVDGCSRHAGDHARKDLCTYGEKGYFSFLKKPFEPCVEQTGDFQNLENAQRFLEGWKETDQPFMLYLPLSMPHPVYSAPQPYHDLYSPEEIPDLRPAVKNGKPDFYSLIRQYRNLESLTERDFKKIQAVYLGMNSCIDMMLGRLLDTLEATGRAQDTTVIVCSDHGDWAGDYGLVEKWPSAFDDTMTRVPLIVRTPGNKAGHVVHEPVEMFDIMPTILELSGIACEHTHFAKSFVPQLKGAAGDAQRAVFAEGGYNRNEPNCFEGFAKREQKANLPHPEQHIYYPKKAQQQEHPESVCRATMLRTLDYKLIYRAQGLSELYDLKHDPRELNNVYEDATFAEVRGTLLAQLLRWYQDTSDAVPYHEDPRGF